HSYFARNISIRRSNTVLENIRHEVVEPEGLDSWPYTGFISVADCAEVTVRNCEVSGRKVYGWLIPGKNGKRKTTGTYDVSCTRALKIEFIGLRQINDICDSALWGVMGSNFCKSITLEKCRISRFDAHQGVTNAVVRDCELGYQGINAIGFGTFLVENSTVCCANFFNLRSDYGSTWEGEFIVRNCTFLPANGRPVTGQLVNGSYSGKHDFGYVCHMPRRIVFDGLKIDDSHHSEKKYEGPWIFGMFNTQNKGPDYVEDYPYHVTEEVVLKNVTTASGKPVNLIPNPYLFRIVKVVR
ncbi:MAG: hypothetical protein IJQ00_03240, partial [Kiritimatiellae bacterium]|nr:hypothetical protein [Kiritimatiellia bacterium]